MKRDCLHHVIKQILCPVNAPRGRDPLSLGRNYPALISWFNMTLVTVVILVVIHSYFTIKDLYSVFLSFLFCLLLSIQFISSLFFLFPFFSFSFPFFSLHFISILFFSFLFTSIPFLSLFYSFPFFSFLFFLFFSFLFSFLFFSILFFSFLFFSLAQARTFLEIPYYMPISCGAKYVARLDNILSCITIFCHY